jgi:cell division protein ZapA (FtsZ GTPase activity inhibitor)
MEDKLSIKVTIANRHYPLRISRSEEEAIRKSAKLINERIKEYEQNYSVTDPQDLLAMCALQFANEASSAKNKKLELSGEQQNKAVEIEQLLDDYLNSI